MKTVFADACYWIAILNPRDNLHAAAKLVSGQLEQCRIVTSEMVLVECLNAFSGKGEAMRDAAVEMVLAIERNSNIEVVPQTSILFQSAFERYASRSDKKWGAYGLLQFLVDGTKRFEGSADRGRAFFSSRFYGFDSKRGLAPPFMAPSNDVLQGGTSLPCFPSRFVFPRKD